jgi:2'-5' RNA ligase
MLTFAEFMGESSNKLPLYMSVKLAADSKAQLRKLQHSLQIPNPLHPDDFHCTLMYSSKPVIHPTPEPKVRYLSAAKGLTVFPTRSGKNALVIELDSAALQARHKQLMALTDGSYDYPDYKPHVTLSYDCGDFKSVPVPSLFLVSHKEACEALDFDKYS